MPSLVETRPNLSFDDAKAILLKHFKIEAELKALPAENDQNFRVVAEDGQRFVLKVANAQHPLDLLEAQDAALLSILDSGCSIPTPRPVPDAEGNTIFLATVASGESYHCRLLTFLDGTPLARIAPTPLGLLEDLGTSVAQIDGVFSRLKVPGAQRQLKWDLGQASWICRETARIGEPGTRGAVERWLIQWRGRIVPLLDDLPTSLIHGDANDENILVNRSETGSWRLSGLIDFGDLVDSQRINEVAIAAAYGVLDRDDPVEALAAVAAGYHRHLPLADAEISALFGLTGLRLCVSTVSAWCDLELDPSNPHQQITRQRAATALEKLDLISWDVAEATIREVIGLSPRSSHSTVLRSEVLEDRQRMFGASLGLSYEDPKLMVKGRGCYLFDESGRSFLDCVNNICHVGHAHPRLTEALSRQARLLNTNTRYLHPSRTRYARRLLSTFPDPLSVCFFVNSGSEANELAVRIARTVTGRKDAIVVEGAYHGNSQTLIDLSPYKHGGAGGAGAPSWVHAISSPDGYRLAEGCDVDGIPERGAAEVRGLCEKLEKEGRAPAFFISEPMFGCGGQVVPPDRWLELCFETARSGGALLIVDEVQVGFGRVGSDFWAFAASGVVPDIVTLGKPMGNGHPMGAVITTAPIAEAFANGMEWFSSFGGNPVSCEVGLALLEVLEDEDLPARAEEVGDSLLSGFEKLSLSHPQVGDVRGRGLFIGVELVRDPLTKEPATEETRKIVEGLLTEGILLSSEGPHDNVLKIKPPLVFASEEASLFLATIDRWLGKVFSSESPG